MGKRLALGARGKERATHNWLATTHDLSPIYLVKPHTLTIRLHYTGNIQQWGSGLDNYDPLDYIHLNTKPYTPTGFWIIEMEGSQHMAEILSDHIKKLLASKQISLLDEDRRNCRSSTEHQWQCCTNFQTLGQVQRLSDHRYSSIGCLECTCVSKDGGGRRRVIFCE